MMLSVVIITYNEERNIRRCLDSIKEIADDIVVIDSFSSDRTEQICKEYNVNFIACEWKGYSDSKNFGNSMAKYDWVFSIDADEAVSNELKISILEAKSRSSNQKNFEVSRLTNYCGTWIKHTGWYPDIKLRFFNKTKSSWTGDLHEKVILPTNTKPTKLKGDLLHYSYYSINDHIQQINKFTDIASNSLYQNGKKAKLPKLLFAPLLKFVRDYFIKLGILDGYSGFQISVLSSYATFLKYAKLRELHSKHT